jgi:hypothetical protein
LGLNNWRLRQVGSANSVFHRKQRKTPLADGPIDCRLDSVFHRKQRKTPPAILKSLTMNNLQQKSSIPNKA